MTPIRRTRLPLLAVLLFAACTNPVQPTAHIRATAFDILLGGETLVSSGGALELTAGETVGPVTVRFRDGDTVITWGSDYFVELEFENESVARFTPTAPGAATGTITGVAPGTTTLRARLMHGRVGSPRAHPDYQSSPVPVHVGAP